MKKKIFSILFALVLAVSFSLVTAVPVGANPDEWYVDASVSASGDGTSSETAFKTIQEGVNAASPGDTIIVAAGTYNEQVIIVYPASNISLVGAGRDNTTIDAGSTRWGAIDIRGASHITISGFTLRNRGATNQDYGINVVCYGFPATAWSTYITVEDCTLDADEYGIRVHNYSEASHNIFRRNIITSDYNGIHLEWTSQNTVTQNTISNATGFAGINLMIGGDDNTVQYNEISGCKYGVNLVQSQGGPSGNVISNNEITKNERGIWWQRNPANVIEYNNIFDNTDYNLYAGSYHTLEAPAPAENNWWGQDPPDAAKFYGSVDYDPWSTSPNPVVPPPVEVWVDDGFTIETPGWGVDHFATIQDGIDAVAEGGTVNVAAGTYTPTATINVTESVTILGPQANVDPRPSMGSTRNPGDTSTEAIIDGGGMYRIIEIEANDVIVDGVVVHNGTGDLIRQSDSYSGTTVRNCIVHSAIDDEGIQLKKCSNGLIEFNYIYDVAQDGANFAESSNCAILNNEVTGSDSENGAIFVYDSSDITIANNYIHDTTANNGIKLYTNYGDITVNNNLIVDNNWKIKSKHHAYSGNGISGYKATELGSTLVIEHNTISDNAVDPDSPYHSGDADFGNGIGLNSIPSHGTIPSYDSQVNIINNIVSFNGGWGVITKAYYEPWGQAPTNVFIDCNDVFGNGAGTFSNSGVTYTTYTLGSNNIYVDPQFNSDYTLQAGSPCIGAACDGEDMGVIPTLTPMASFVIDHAKLDFKKKADDDKVRVKGKLELGANSDGVEISDDVIVTVDSVSDTITMVVKGKKGEKWQYKRPKDGIGNIKKMTINWKNGKFDIRMDKADLNGLTDPEVTISIQIGDDFGEKTITMRVKKHHWDYKAK